MKIPHRLRSWEYWTGWALYVLFAVGGYFAAATWIRPHSITAFWLAWVVAMIAGSIMGVRTENTLRARKRR